MMKTRFLPLIVAALLLGLPRLALVQEATPEATASPFQITLENVVPPETCTEFGWRFTYERIIVEGEYARKTLWRYFVQTVDGDLNLVDFWESGYNAYVQDYMLHGNPLRDDATSAGYAVRLSSNTYNAESIEYVLDGDAVIWEIRATVRCEAGIVVEADIVSQPVNTTREALPLPGDNLVLALDDIPIYEYPTSTTHLLGTIRACQTFFLSDIRMPRASISTYGRESITGHEIVLSGGLSPTRLVDVAEDYGQPGGQPILSDCSQDASP